MTRKTLLVLFVLVALMIAVSTATAQNEIVLGGSATDSITFTGSTTGWTLSFTPNPLTGLGPGNSATGENGWSPITGAYSVNQEGATIAGTVVSPGFWDITQTGGSLGGALLFSIVSGSTTLLSGDLQLVSLAQTGKTGTFNYDLIANLTSLGGIDASLVGSAAELAISIDFNSTTDLSTLTGTTNTLLGKISSGEIEETPEAASMVLVGSGLILLGGLVRRRRKAAGLSK